MPYGLYVSAEGAEAQSRRLDVIANNMANVNTPGFKRDVAIFEARFAEAIERQMDHPGAGTINDLSGGVQVLQTLTEFAPGPVENTGLQTDVAIDGEGFFLVLKGGQPFLTRAGNFQVNAAGQLVTQGEGLPVIDVNGAPIFIDPEAGPWQVTPDGGIQQAGDTAFLALVRPPNFEDLVKVGENLFFSTSPTLPIDPAVRRVLPGHLELSTVRPTTEMVDMIDASRAFEANITMIRNHDHMLGTLISRVLSG